MCTGIRIDDCVRETELLCERFGINRVLRWEPKMYGNWNAGGEYLDFQCSNRILKKMAFDKNFEADAVEAPVTRFCTDTV